MLKMCFPIKKSILIEKRQKMMKKVIKKDKKSDKKDEKK